MRPAKRGPAPKLQQHIEAISLCPSRSSALCWRCWKRCWLRRAAKEEPNHDDLGIKTESAR